MIVSGGQQGLELACKIFCNEGDTVICEDPSFIGALNSFRSNGARTVGVPMEQDGISLEALEQTLKSTKNAKLLYLIPTFQNPTGITMSVEKRRAVLALAKKYGIVILEDNPYGELRFTGEEVPTLKSLDEYGRVIYFGSYSKVLAPGMRLGFTSAPAPLLERMIICKQTQDVHTNVLSQMIAYRFVTTYSIDEHIEGLRKAYGKKCKLMMDLMDEHFPKSVKHTCPEGGLFLYCTMPEGYDSKELMKLALEKKVAFVPGTSCMIDDKASYSTFRMNYSAASEADIEKGIKALGEVLHDFLEA
jgi:2-aminoadipate transaminase